LARRRCVLGVEDGDELPAHQRKGDIQSAGFGPWPAIRRDDDFIAWRQLESRQRPARCQVIGFDDELYVELAARIVAALGSKLT